MNKNKQIEECRRMNKNKQIEEMAKFICDLDETCEECQKSYNKKYAKVPCWMRDIAENIYNAGYRKQSEGEWVKPYKGVCADPFYTCSACGAGTLLTQRVDNDKVVRVLTPYCPHCGAKMKGGE